LLLLNYGRRLIKLTFYKANILKLNIFATCRRLAITNKTSNDFFIASTKKWKEKNHDVGYLDYYVLNEGMSL
jgi:hypothetical protein